MRLSGRRLRTPREVALEVRTALESFAKNATVMHNVEDTTTLPSFADCYAPTRAASNQPATYTSAWADVHHSSICHPHPHPLPHPPPTTISFPFANPLLESGMDHSISSHSVQSPRDAIKSEENVFHFYESPNHHPPLTSKPSHHSTKANQEGDIQFVKQHKIQHVDDCSDADELYAGLVKQFGFDKISIDIIYDPDFYSNLEIPGVEAKENMLNHR